MQAPFVYGLNKNNWLFVEKKSIDLLDLINTNYMS